VAVQYEGCAALFCALSGYALENLVAEGEDVGFGTF
jgi:hypothetical protein